MILIANLKRRSEIKSYDFNTPETFTMSCFFPLLFRLKNLKNVPKYCNYQDFLFLNRMLDLLHKISKKDMLFKSIGFYHFLKKISQPAGELTYHAIFRII